MGLILGIDTSSRELGIGLVRDGSVVAGTSLYVKNSHADQIARTVEFHCAGFGTQAIDQIGIAVGPGSFTGLRIGISFLKGFCLGRDIPVFPVSSLEAVAWAWEPMYNSLVVAFDARRDQTYWARFSRAGQAVVRETEDLLSPVEDLAVALRKEDAVVIDSLGNAKCTLSQRLSSAQTLWTVDQFPTQRGVACAIAASYGSDDGTSWMDASAVTPRYLSSTYVDQRVRERTGGTAQ